MVSTSQVPRPKRVLVVDDDPAICDFLQETLAAGGWAADVASSAQEAVRLFAINRYDLITLDCFMPGTTGVELHHVLSHVYGFGRRLSPLLPQRLPPVLVITGFSQHVLLRDLAFGEGVVGVLQKPVAPEHLTCVVKGLLDWEATRSDRRAKALKRLRPHLRKTLATPGK